MSVKACLQCKKLVKKTITFGIFPTDSFKWCSEKCLFLWILKHNVKVDDELIDEIKDRKGRISVLTDLVSIDDLSQ